MLVLRVDCMFTFISDCVDLFSCFWIVAFVLVVVVYFLLVLVGLVVCAFT